MNTKQMLKDALKAARDIAQKASNEGRGLTAAERQSFDEHMKAADRYREVIHSDEMFEKLSEIPDSAKRGAKASGVLSLKGLAGQLKAAMRDNERGFSVKSLIAEGSTVTTAQTIESPVAMAKPATGLLDILPVRFIEDGDQYTYLQQTVRTNNAAPVAVGGTKPTSVYTFVRKDGKLQVIAHLSEPIPEYYLKDEPALQQFLSDEMGYGLQLTLENQALNGDGVEPNLPGLLGVSGIQTQAYTTSQIKTVRSAITKVEVLGYIASGIALNPLDWESIETASVDEAHYALGDVVPVDRAARRLWGVPVAVTNAITQGTGLLLSETPTGPAAKVVADPSLDFKLGVVGDDFSKNQVRGRFEGRFGVECYHPSGVVEIELTDE
jgi:HK97 family phage major capsid protein